MTTSNTDQAINTATEAAAAVLDDATAAERKVLDKVDEAQNVVGKVTPVATEFKSVTSPADIKRRLDWGEPALTIIDVRDRSAYNQERIVGAIPLPMSELADRAKETLELSRDIYVYADDDAQTSAAAQALNDAGFKKVSAIKGGLSAWKAVGGAIEGQEQKPGLLDGGANLVGQTATP